jgi:hypothetical protein
MRHRKLMGLVIVSHSHLVAVGMKQKRETERERERERERQCTPNGMYIRPQCEEQLEESSK